MTRTVVEGKEAKEIIKSFTRTPDFRLEYEGLKFLLEQNVERVAKDSELKTYKNENGNSINAYLYSQEAKYALRHNIRIVFHYDETTVHILGFSATLNHEV